jgi:glycosyl transferase family 25
MKAFVISLPAASGRRGKIMPQLERAGLPYEIVDAVTGQEIEGELQRYCRSLYSPRYRCYLTLNEVACCVSHGRALERFLATEETCGFILEDDAVVPPGITKSLPHRLPPDFDILKLGGDSNPATVSAEARIRRTNKPTMGAYAYIVSRPGARKLLSRLTPVTVQYDSYLRHVYEHGCIVYETVPHLAGVDDEGVSHIGLRALMPGRLTLQHRLSSLRFKIRHKALHFSYKLRHGREPDFEM